MTSKMNVKLLITLRRRVKMNFYSIPIRCPYCSIVIKADLDSEDIKKPSREYQCVVFDSGQTDHDKRYKGCRKTFKVTFEITPVVTGIYREVKVQNGPGF